MRLRDEASLRRYVDPPSADPPSARPSRSRHSPLSGYSDLVPASPDPTREEHQEYTAAEEEAIRAADKAQDEFQRRFRERLDAAHDEERGSYLYSRD